TLPGRFHIPAVMPIVNEVASLQHHDLHVTMLTRAEAEIALEEAARACRLAANDLSTIPGSIRFRVVAPVVNQLAILRHQGLEITLKIALNEPALARCLATHDLSSLPEKVRLRVVASIVNLLIALQDKRLEVTAAGSVLNEPR